MTRDQIQNIFQKVLCVDKVGSLIKGNRKRSDFTELKKIIK